MAPIRPPVEIHIEKVVAGLVERDSGGALIVTGNVMNPLPNPEFVMIIGQNTVYITGFVVTCDDAPDEI